MTVRDWAALLYLITICVLYILPVTRHVSDLEQHIIEMQEEIDELKSAVFIAPDGKER